MRFKALNEPAFFVRSKVVLYGRRPCKRMSALDSCRRFELLKIENRAIRLGLRAKKGEPRELNGPIALNERYGAVGCSEIDSNKIR